MKGEKKRFENLVSNNAQGYKNRELGEGPRQAARLVNSYHQTGNNFGT